MLLALLYGRMDWRGFWDIVRNVNPVLLMGFFAICVINMWLTSMRWGMLLRADGLEVPTAKLFASHWIGSFFNFFMPSNIGGDVYRVADIAKKSGKAVNALASVFADRLLGFVAMAALGFVFPLFGLGKVPSEHRAKLLIPLGVFFCFMVLVALIWQREILLWFARFLPSRIRGKVEDVLGKFLESAQAYGKKPMVLIKCMMLSFLSQFNLIVAVFCVGASLGLGIPFFLYCVFVPLVGLLEAVPSTINGMGFRDAGYIMFFTAAGLEPPAAPAAAMSLLYMMLTLLYASFGGLIFLRRLSKK